MKYEICKKQWLKDNYHTIFILKDNYLICILMNGWIINLSKLMYLLNASMDQATRTLVQFAATLPSCRSSGRPTPASLCAVTWGPRLRSSIIERRSVDRRRQKQNSHAGRRMAAGNTLTERQMGTGTTLTILFWLGPIDQLMHSNFL
jgi:hypothetical protein